MHHLRSTQDNPSRGPQGVSHTKSTGATESGDTTQSSDRNVQESRKRQQNNNGTVDGYHFKALGHRSGIMKYRALDLLSKEPKKDVVNNEKSDLVSSTASHGGPIFRPRLSDMERERISRSRAAELSALYELSESKDTDLNKNADISWCSNALAPSLSATMMTLKQAVQIVSQESDESLSEVVPSSVFNPSGSMEESDSNESGPPLKKGSFDVPRQIRAKLGFPKQNASASRLDDKRSVQGADAHDDSENCIPNFIQHDAMEARRGLDDKRIIETPNAPNAHTTLHPKNIVLPELC